MRTNIVENGEYTHGARDNLLFLTPSIKSTEPIQYRYQLTSDKRIPQNWDENKMSFKAD